MTANNQEALAQFFNDSLLREDSEDDIDKIKWATAFNKLSINMTKKDVIKIFDYIDSEKLGYIDRFDFMEFCAKQHFNDPTIKHLKDILISRIEAFLRMSCIGDDESIEIIYSKHTINPCKPTNNESHDPYYNYYYDDDVFHEFDPREFAMLEIKNCLCCSHCGKQSNTFILWKKHESKCKYDAEKYIAYLISAIDQDEDISFLDDNKVVESVIESVIEYKNSNNGVPPPPPLPPPPPPLNEYVIRYNDNEMGEIMMQIPDKIPIWSRLFVSTNKDTLTGKRLESLENNNSYIKCTKSSAYKDYRDILQKKMFDLLLSVPKRTNGKIGKMDRFKITSNTDNNLNINSSYSISSPNQVNNYIVERKSSEPIHKFVKFKLQNSTTELTNTDDYKSSIPKYVGDLEESDVDDYDTTRISDTIDDTDYHINHHNLNKISISQPVSDNDNDNNFNNFNNFNKQYANAGSQGAPRSKSSFNLTITQPIIINSNNKLNIPILSISQNTNLDQQTVGQQTVETADSEEVSSADSLSSMTAEEENKQNNMIKTSGYHASIDMGSIDMSNHFGVRNGSMSLNPLNERIASPISSPNTPLTLDNNSHTFKSMITSIHLNLNDVLNDDNSNMYPYYENIIDLILEFSHVNNPLYVDGYLMLHEMVFDIYNNYYNKIWYKYRLNLWLLLLFDQHRINELEKHYKINKTTNNYENGKLKWIYNLHDMIYYDQSLFTHLLHTYGIPPSLKSLIWFHISHNHHIITDLDIFLYNTDIESLNIIDMPLVDNVLNNIFNKIYNTDIVQSVLMKAYVFQPFKHHNSHSYDIRRIINGKNKKKLLPNLYNPQNRDIFYYDILYILLQHIWSKLPIECQQIIYQFWAQMQIQTNGNNQWLFGNINVINKLFLNSNNINDIEFIMSIYLWDGMTGIGILLTSIILIAIHSKKSINHFYKNPLIQSQTHKIPKVYKSVYDYIVHKSDYDNVSISEIVIKKLLHII
eukprot:117268_1